MKMIERFLSTPLGESGRKSRKEDVISLPFPGKDHIRNMGQPHSFQCPMTDVLTAEDAAGNALSEQ